MSWKDDVRGLFRDERDRDRDREEFDRNRGRSRGYANAEDNRPDRGYDDSYGSGFNRARYGNESTYDRDRYGSDRYGSGRYGDEPRYGSSESYGDRDRSRDFMSGGSMERERFSNRDRGTSYGTYGRDWDRERDREFGSGGRDWNRGRYESEGTSRGGYSSGSRYSGGQDRYSSGRHSSEDFGSMDRGRSSGGPGRHFDEDRYEGSRDRWGNENSDFSSGRGRWSSENERMSSDRYSDRWDRGGYDRDDDWRNRR